VARARAPAALRVRVMRSSFEVVSANGIALRRRDHCPFLARARPENALRND
jgi:hypothetical protein